MKKEELKLECLKLAYSILGVLGSAIFVTSEKKPSVDEVITEAKKMFNWIDD